MDCNQDNHVFEFWGADKKTGGIPKGWKCKCGEKKYQEENAETNE